MYLDDLRGQVLVPLLNKTHLLVQESVVLFKCRILNNMMVWSQIFYYIITCLKQYCWDRGIGIELGRVIHWAISTLGPGAYVG